MARPKKHKSTAWKNYYREPCGSFSPGAVKTILNVLVSKGNSADRGACECADAVTLIDYLRNEATELAKRSHLSHLRAEALAVAAADLRVQNAEMKKLISMQQRKLEQTL